MVRFKKIRPSRASLAVSIIWGSPIAANNRSAAFAYAIVSLRHNSRYSEIDISVSPRASNDRAKALNRESLYISVLLSESARSARYLRPDASTTTQSLSYDQ